jgi:hypothetical protein
MHIAVTRRTEIFKRIVERATTTTAYRQPGLIGGAPGATLFPRIQPHGAAVEIPEFARFYTLGSSNVGCPRGARRSRMCLVEALGGLKNAVRKEGLTDEPVYRSCYVRRFRESGCFALCQLRSSGIDLEHRAERKLRPDGPAN